MATITTKDTFGKSNTYEVVDKIPYGFFIWNIGENMGDKEYIPIAELKSDKPEDKYSINPNTVKAIKVGADNAKILNKAVTWGINTLADAKRIIKGKRYRANRKQLAELALPILEVITE